jgi:hypothetical protein
VVSTLAVSMRELVACREQLNPEDALRKEAVDASLVICYLEGDWPADPVL